MVQPELLGEGSYGCVFRPEVPCVTKKKYIADGKRREKSTDLVGKIFSDARDFRDEWKLSQKVAKIDPKGKALLLPTSACLTSREKVLSNPASGECEQMFYTPQNSTSNPMYQLTMPYGGSDLYKYAMQYMIQNKKPIPMKMFVKMMEPVFDGLILLDAKKWCHQDIKTPNIMVTPQGKAILIDYGLMVPYKEVYAPTNRRRLRYSYFPYPPEYKMAYYQWHPCTDTCSIEKEVMKNIYQFGNDRARYYFSYVDETEVRSNIRKFLNDLGKHRNDLQAYLTKFANRVDVYSLGTSILDVLKYIDTKSLTSAQQDAWRLLIRSMILPNPIDRTTPKKAKQLLHSLKKIL